MPLGTRGWQWGRLVVLAREEGGPPAPAALGRAVQDVLPDMRVSASLLSDRLRQHTADTRAQAATISALGGFTLLLAGLGLYALVAQLVAERTRELGIRAALGAAPARLVSLVVRSVGASVLAGLGAGVLVATLAVRLLSRFLFETGPFDPLAWTGAVLVLLAVGSTAVFVPARRAARLDPAVVLRD